jgi:Holliday junction DNA helicase RuvB
MNEAKLEVIRNLCRKKEDYLTALREVLKIERGERPMPDHFGWSMLDIKGMSVWLLGRLKQEDIIECTYDSNKGKWFRLMADVTVAELEQVLTEVEKEIEQSKKMDTGESALLEFLTEKKTVLPPDLFSIIYGHDDLKTIFKLSLNADMPVHILLKGKPASAKSLFLSEISRLDGSVYALGGTSTKVGLRDVIATGVKYLIIDELDKIETSNDLAALLEWMESGKMPILKHKTYCLVKNPGWVFAACNRLDKLPIELRSRFLVMDITEYTEEELKGVILKILTEREHKTEEEAELIARVVIEYLESLDPRDAIKIARLSKTKDDIETIARIMKKYGRQDE